MSKKNYYRILLGEGNKYADQCREENFIGIDYGINFDLGDLSHDWLDFKQEFTRKYLEKQPDVAVWYVNFYCGRCYELAKTMRPNNVVLCREEDGDYSVGTVEGDYAYCPSGILPHRRNLPRRRKRIKPAIAMSSTLQSSLKAPSTLISLNGHADEIDRLLGDTQGETDTNSARFSMEKYLEYFLVENWDKTPLGRDYDIYAVDGELAGQQYRTPSGGRIDILAVSKDRKTLLVVELKRDKGVDQTLGQVQRYMGEIMGDIAEKGQSVKGLIIAHEADVGLQKALTVVPNVAFRCYEVSFNLLEDE